MDDLKIIATITTLVSVLGPLLFKVIIEYRNAARARERVLEAEKEAFRTVPEALAVRKDELAAPHELLEQRTKQIAELVDRAQASLQVGVLLNLYNKQIEKYQAETQVRATISFIFAILAMCVGLGLVIWGGTKIFDNGDWKKVAAGSAISAIGGALSAYVSKTFLDIHRLSLLQFNRYFRQPVLNAYVLTAQRLADQIDEAGSKRDAYQDIIGRVLALIREDEDLGISASALLDKSPPTQKRSRMRLRPVERLSKKGMQTDGQEDATADAQH